MLYNFTTPQFLELHHIKKKCGCTVHNGFDVPVGLVYSADEWESEWANVLRLASSAPRGGQETATDGTQDCGHKLAASDNANGKSCSISSSSKRLSNG